LVVKVLRRYSAPWSHRVNLGDDAKKSLDALLPMID
jgi:hypothetical protein